MLDLHVINYVTLFSSEAKNDMYAKFEEDVAFTTEKNTRSTVTLYQATF